MKYMLLLIGDEDQRIALSDDERRAMMKEYDAFTEEVERAGKYVAGDGLQPSPTATTIQVRDGERILSDGPFAETKEQVGGFYLLDCDDLDEALDWAAKIPAARVGAVEVRPVMDYEAVR